MSRAACRRHRTETTPRRAVWCLATLVLVSAGDGCGWLDPNSEDEALESSEARAFPVFSPQRPTSAAEQALQALAQDAWRRELRFMDAADPGFAFRSVRPFQHELESGRFSTEDWFTMGGQLFTMNFSESMGFGGADLPSMSRFHRGERGGPDARRCASCHWRGGPAGAGDAADNAFFRGDGNLESTALVRNPPSLLGAGWKQLVAEEMTAELAALREEYVEFARSEGAAFRAPLRTHGVSFGALIVSESGEIDTSEVEGIDDDLVVRPFGWKGAFIDLRDVVEDALNVHHGLQSTYLARTAPKARVGDGGPRDPDADGVEDEINEGQVSLLTMFIAMQDVPVDQPPLEPDQVLLYARGRQSFADLGCAECHVPQLPIERSRYILPSRDDDGREPLEVDLLQDGAQPRLQPDPITARRTLALYSDLKRHHMGDALAEPRADAGVDADVFLTPPLWGIARSRPYLHDARAPTLEDAILLHGGEAQASRDAFDDLSEDERAPLRVFLTSLTRGQRLVSP